VIVRGGSGVGKSALLSRVLHRARADGHLVLSATADSLETPTDFGVVHQLFEHVAERELDETVQAAIADFQAPYRAAAALTRADRRVVLGIDDLQWADTASVTWLGRLLRRLEGLRVTVVATMGPGIPSGDEHCIGTLLPLFRHRIWLTPLGDAEVGELAEVVLGTEPEGRPRARPRVEAASGARRCAAPRTGRPVRIGYARTSTARQELASQLEALRRAECHKIFHEQISTRIKVRPELEKALARAHQFKEAAPETRSSSPCTSSSVWPGTRPAGRQRSACAVQSVMTRETWYWRMRQLLPSRWRTSDRCTEASQPAGSRKVMSAKPPAACSPIA
jgi:AAA ATPase-like protein/resolvase-like protein